MPPHVFAKMPPNPPGKIKENAFKKDGAPGIQMLFNILHKRLDHCTQYIVTIPVFFYRGYLFFCRQIRIFYS